MQVFEILLGLSLHHHRTLVLGKIHMMMNTWMPGQTRRRWRKQSKTFWAGLRNKNRGCWSSAWSGISQPVDKIFPNPAYTTYSLCSAQQQCFDNLNICKTYPYACVLLGYSHVSLHLYGISCDILMYCVQSGGKSKGSWPRPFEAVASIGLCCCCCSRWHRASLAASCQAKPQQAPRSGWSMLFVRISLISSGYLQS